MKRTRAIERQPKASVDWKPTSTCPFSELRLQLINPSTSPNELNTTLTPHSIIHGDACFAYFNKIWGIPAAAILQLDFGGLATTLKFLNRERLVAVFTW